MRLKKQRRNWPGNATKNSNFKTFATDVETALLSRSRQRRSDQESILRDHGRSGATFAFRVETVQFSKPRRRRRDFSDQGGDGAIFQTKADTARLFRPMRRRRDQRTILSERGGCGATLAIRAEMPKTKADTARLFRTRRRRRDFPAQGGDSATFATKVDTTRLRKRHDSKSNGATCLASVTKNCNFKTFATEVDTALLSRPRWRRRDFSDQSGEGAVFQTKTETARLSRPRQRRCDQDKIPRDRVG